MDGVTVTFRPLVDLESKEQQEGHHKTEEAHGLRKSETENSIWEELLLETGIPCVSDNEGSEHRSDSSSWSGNADGGSAGSDEFGSTVDITGYSGGVQWSPRRQDSKAHGCSQGLIMCWNLELCGLWGKDLRGRTDSTGHETAGHDGGDHLYGVHLCTSVRSFSTAKQLNTNPNT